MRQPFGVGLFICDLTFVSCGGWTSSCVSVSIELLSWCWWWVDMLLIVQWFHFYHIDNKPCVLLCEVCSLPFLGQNLQCLFWTILYAFICHVKLMGCALWVNLTCIKGHVSDSLLTSEYSSLLHLSSLTVRWILAVSLIQPTTLHPSCIISAILEAVNLFNWIHSFIWYHCC